LEFGGLATQKDELSFFPIFEVVLFPNVIHGIFGAISPSDAF
jgi:hypothetical protein